MTWTKTGAEFASDAANVDLTDAAFRTHFEAIEWLYRVERMDCHVPGKLVRRIAGSEDHEAAVQQLLDVGFWRRCGDDFEVIHHGDVIRQSLAWQLKKREQDKARQRKRRRRLAAEESADISTDNGADVSADVTRDVMRDPVRDVAETQSVSLTDLSQDRGELGNGVGTYDDDAWLNGRTR